MAITIAKFQEIQKVAAEEYLLLHPETDADVVLLAVEQIEAANVQDALIELSNRIKDITDGGVVTGVKGSAESSYRKGDVNITPANIGLGNVNNTSDANKPISTAQQAALDLKENKANLKALAYKDSLSKTDVGLGNVTNDAQVKRSEMGTASGVATLDTNGKVPSSQLPSYVDDVLEYDSLSAFPATGETGKIYIAKDTNKTYRWSGTAYTEISASLALGETSSTAYAGNKGKQNADDIAALKTRTANIEAKNTSQDTAISAAKTQADKGVADAAAAQKTANDAKAAAQTNATAIADIVDGTTKVAKATAADSATIAGKLSNARTIALKGDATGSAAFDGSANKDITVTLANSGVTAGTYSVTTVDSKGRVVAGAQVVEVGATGQEAPSSSLAIGGIFFKRI